MPVDLIIYAIIAAGLIFWLRGTLGTRQEGDEPKSMAGSLADLEALAKGDTNIPGLALKGANIAEDQIAVVKADKSNVIGINEKSAESGLTDIIEADKDFDLKFFLNAAQDVFVMVVESFAEGDRDTLQDCLAAPVYKAFDGALTSRKDGETMETQITAIHEARVIEAKLDKKIATITLRFVADEATVTRDANGKTLNGDLDRASSMTDIWTFGRDIKSRDPRWFVYETRGDFEGDNELIPNSD